MKEFEIEFKMGEKTIVHKIITNKKIPEMYLMMAEEFINTTLTIKRIK